MLIMHPSIRALEGKKKNRIDDLESLLYLLFEMCYADFPWKDLEEKDENEIKNKVLKMKKKYIAKIMKTNEFQELKKVYKEIRTLKFEEEPNYNKYIKILNDWIKNSNQEKDNNFCLKWEKS